MTKPRMTQKALAGLKMALDIATSRPGRKGAELERAEVYVKTYELYAAKRGQRRPHPPRGPRRIFGVRDIGPVPYEAMTLTQLERATRPR